MVDALTLAALVLSIIAVCLTIFNTVITLHQRHEDKNAFAQQRRDANLRDLHSAWLGEVRNWEPIPDTYRVLKDRAIDVLKKNRIGWDGSAWPPSADGTKRSTADSVLMHLSTREFTVAWRLEVHSAPDPDPERPSYFGRNLKNLDEDINRRLSVLLDFWTGVMHLHTDGVLEYARNSASGSSVGFPCTYWGNRLAVFIVLYTKSSVREAPGADDELTRFRRTLQLTHAYLGQLHRTDDSPISSRIT